MSKFDRKVTRNQCRIMVGNKNRYVKTCYHKGIAEADKEITAKQNKSEKNRGRNK